MFCLVLAVYRLPDLFLHFLYKDPKSKIRIVFCTKKRVVQGSRVLKLSLFICLYYRRTGIGVFLFTAGGL